ncbi:MAG: bifunctional diguanylate cyclase/phosphodiesterase [Thiomicrospira sp.]|uniref:putative bifunctional diguanylate cyclase/phosphodiesterase n=1 Tax=Thiomicrospira sp. TaxID=935 RepID=UPI001A0FBB9E|nr:bifunctional diguanylate cyclase/phosphodiesterase [Thiomicrospira sp.]MBE0492932.1 bifunctional diguanylate cyclase/phosphodiesterase [Thiomicrospira sp.]
MKRSISAKYVLIGFMVVALSLLLTANFGLYFEGQKIQQSVHDTAQIEAQKELFSAIDRNFKSIDQQLKKLTEWDEVHQQLNQSSYYYYWRDQRLKDSEYFKPYYIELDIYQADKLKLSHLVKDQQLAAEALPKHLNSQSRYFLIQPPHHDYLIVSHAVYSRQDPSQVIGHVAIAIDFFELLAQDNQFYYLDFPYLHFNRSGFIGMHQLKDALEYRAISNPVSDHLWNLIEGFVVKFALIILATTLIVFGFIKLIFLDPLQKLSLFVKGLRSQAHANQTEVQASFVLEEHQNLQKQLSEYHHALLDAQAQLSQQNQKLWQISRTDPLTEVGNRRAFDDAWHALLQQYGSQPTTIAYMLFDCDHFKALNDTYGHQVGDELIKISAQTLQRSFPAGQNIYRIGGDEFASLVVDKTVDEVEQIAQKALSDLISYPFVQLDIKEKVSFSVGVGYAGHNQAIENIEVLPRQADIAMYKAKHSPHNKVHFYQHGHDTSNQSLVSNKRLNQVLTAAYTGQNICLHYQPILNIKTQDIYYEALVRLQFEDETVFPSDIFTIIAHHRLEVELDQQILNYLLSQLQQKRLPANIGLSVNISAKTLLQPFIVDLFEPFLVYLKQHKIVIEITESILIEHIQDVSFVLNKLRRQGFLIALDDFGSGYSSIRYLANMPVDIVKFDMTLTHALNADLKTQRLIQSTAHMIREAGYELVMEGVETQQQLELATQAGATNIQGYYIGRPNFKPNPPGLVA